MGAVPTEALALWPPAERDTARAVALAESGGRLDALCDSCLGVRERSAGPWQVNVYAWPQFDPERLRSDWAYTAAAARQVWAVQGWRAWSAYTNGAYRAYLTGTDPTGGALADPAPEATRVAAGAVPAAPTARAALPLLVALGALLWALEVL